MGLLWGRWPAISPVGPVKRVAGYIDARPLGTVWSHHRLWGGKVPEITQGDHISWEASQETKEAWEAHVRDGEQEERSK